MDLEQRLGLLGLDIVVGGHEERVPRAREWRL
jgi:hypothetical protein